MLIGLLPLGVLGAGLVTTVDDDATLIEDPTPSPWPIDVLDNDTFPDGATIIGVTQGAIGTVTIAGDGLSVSYAPDVDANGSDSFTYTLDDGIDSDTGTVSVTVEPQNDAPSGANKTVATSLDTPRAFVTGDFGFSDVRDSPPNTLLSVRITTLPGAGELTDDGVAVNAGDLVAATDIASSKLVFTPASGGSGSPYATFTFQVRDNGGTVGVNLDPTPRTMTIDVTDTNQDPVAVDDEATVTQDGPATAVNVLANDSDPDDDSLTITGKTNGTKGTVVITGGGTGLTYEPDAAATGSDSFTYTISDGRGGSDTASVAVTISAANRRPNAANDAGLIVPESAGATALDVLANDTDPDGDSLAITATTNGNHGKVAITGGGTGLTYNPKQLYVGNDVFTYTVSDGRGGTDTASVLVTVARDTTKPIAIAPLERYKKGTVARKSAKVRLSWSATDSGTGVARYKLQVSTNGGPYRTIALPRATSTTIKRSLTDKQTYRFRVRAFDKEGNRSAYAYGPSLNSVRVQDKSATLDYSGSWGTKRTAKASGGTARFATSTSAAVSITRTMRDVAWVAVKTPTSGQAEVWIDGDLVATVNLRGSKAYRKVVFQAHFATLASHTLEIRPIGGGRVYLDAILVVR